MRHDQDAMGRQWLSLGPYASRAMLAAVAVCLALPAPAAASDASPRDLLVFCPEDAETISIAPTASQMRFFLEDRKVAGTKASSRQKQVRESRSGRASARSDAVAYVEVRSPSFLKMRLFSTSGEEFRLPEVLVARLPEGVRSYRRGTGFLLTGDPMAMGALAAMVDVTKIVNIAAASGPVEGTNFLPQALASCSVPPFFGNRIHQPPYEVVAMGDSVMFTTDDGIVTARTGQDVWLVSGDRSGTGVNIALLRFE